MASVFRSAVLITAIACCSISCAKQPPSEKGTEAKDAKSASPSAQDEKKKAGIMIGMDIAKSLEPIKDEFDREAMVKAFNDTLDGKPSGMTQEESDAFKAEFGAKMQAKMQQKAEEKAQKNLAEGEKFLAENKNKPGVHTTESGLEYEVIRQGNGPTPKPTDRVKVHYVGTLLDGTKFDASKDHGDQPAEFTLNQVIPGWTEGVGLMPVGSKYKLWVPSKLGYGQGGPSPNAVLVFEVDLVGIEPAQQ